ncbi:hypothetical protein LUZ63_001870 [Rhynchospora breviuscula]|uniref:BRO1 domain-containing protein n=1 Tax=Rhynchospora breviuscula TaxID=2022672 RepID=A0A9Q0CXR4_9POAL|nr:hypothetical protein LUZ63_001870 [Rhynchospora breviuscula]
MGCFASTPSDTSGQRRRPGSIGEVVVYIPGFRIPKSIDFTQSIGESLPKNLIDRISGLRTRVVVMAAQESPIASKSRRRTATRHGGSSSDDLLQALEEYLPVLLGLAEDGRQLRDKLNFVWLNQEDAVEETGMTNVWYEVLSVLHLMAMLCLSQANSLLMPKSYSDGYQPRVSEESRRNSVEIFLKASGYLDCAIRQVLPQIGNDMRRELPVDLAEGNLRAISLQALGQAVDLQLGMAIDSPKATLAVKRRLACEMVKYWQQAQDNIAVLPLQDGWGKKHQLFVKWKFLESKAAAYYFHGLILDEGNTEKSHRAAAAALHASEEFLRESKKASDALHSTSPTSRSPVLWGSMKYLSEKIPKEASSKVRINRDLYSQESVIDTAPVLPDFPLALKPDDYQLPQADLSWKRENKQQQENL